MKWNEIKVKYKIKLPLLTSLLSRLVFKLFSNNQILSYVYFFGYFVYIYLMFTFFFSIFINHKNVFFFSKGIISYHIISMLESERVYNQIGAEVSRYQYLMFKRLGCKKRKMIMLWDFFDSFKNFRAFLKKKNGGRRKISN